MMPGMTGRLPVVVAIPVRNEAENITTTVRSVIDHFEAVVVVDSDSTDATRALAADAGAEVVPYVWDGKYPKKKQWCLDNVHPEIPWMLHLDGDESVTPELIAELREIFAAGPGTVTPAAFDIPLLYWFAGKPLRRGHTVVKRSLLDRTRVAYPAVDDIGAPGIGEVEGHYQPRVEGPVAVLKGRLEHRDLDPVRTWFDRHNRYSDWEAWLEHHPAAKEQVLGLKTKQGRLFQKVPFKPLIFFGYTYVARRGFLDGRAGLDYALALSFYRWQIGLKQREQALAAGE
jgi:glycosyltransferase involved in cell wall biosynthesis